MKNRLIILIAGILIFCICSSIRHAKVERYYKYYFEHIIPGEHGLRVYYYNNLDWEGSPVSTRVERRIYLESADTLGLAGVGEYNVSVIWQGLLAVPVSGGYKFKLYSDDGSRLFLNGVSFVKNDGFHSYRGVSVRKYITRGVYPIEIKYFQGEGEAAMSLYWEPPEPFHRLKGPISSIFFRPLDEGFNRNTAFRLGMVLRRWNLLVAISIFILVLCIINLRIGFTERWFYFIILSIRNNFLAFAVLILGIVFRSLFLSSVPGLYGDEAWSTLAAYSFLEGKEVNLLRGMTVYTGPFFLLQVPIYILFGYNTVALRILPVFFTTLALLFCYLLIKRIYDKLTALIALLILSFWPVTFIFSRISIEILSLSLFFIFISLYLISTQRLSGPSPLSSPRGTRVSGSGEGRVRGLILAGFVLGIGIYNHILFVCFPITLFLLGLLETRGRLIFYKKFYLVLLPIFLFVGIKLLDFFKSGFGRSYNPFGDINLQESIYIMKYSTIHLLLKVIDGGFLYKYFTGRLLVNVIPISLIILSICIAMLFIRRRFVDKNILRLLFIIVVSYIIIMLRIPQPGLRYFYIPITLSGLIPSICLAKLLWTKNRITRYLVIGMIAIMTITNIAQISINYFYSFRNKTSESFHKFDERLSFPAFLVSHYYLDTRKLYKYLVENGFNQVAAIWNIRLPLMVWDIGNNVFHCYEEDGYKGRPKEALVFYDKPITREISFPEELGYSNLKEIRDVEGFRIYVSEY